MLPTKILPDAWLTALKKNAKLYSSLKQGFNTCRGVLPKIKHPNLPGRIHPNDFMLKSYTHVGKKQYLEDSKLQFQLIEDTLKNLGKTWLGIQSMIDIGSGYGRILRWATQKIPAHTITACDVNESAVKFCTKEFGCRGVVTNHDFSAGNFQHYDLFFSCSVLTHLTEKNTTNYFKKIADIANPNATLIFSLHGKSSIDKASEKINTYLNSKIINDTLKKGGFYFYPYPHYPNDLLGDTFFTIEYLENIFRKNNLPINIHSHVTGPAYGWLHDWLVCTINKKV